MARTYRVPRGLCQAAMVVTVVHLLAELRTLCGGLGRSTPLLVLGHYRKTPSGPNCAQKSF